MSPEIMPTSLKEKVEIVQSILTSIAILVGGIWGVNEYLEKQHQDRISKSYEIVSEFRKNEDVVKYLEFSESTDVNSILHDKLLSAPEKSKKIAEIHKEDHRRQLKRIIGIYENAVACVISNHCDKSVIATFMAPVAHSTYVIGFGLIREIGESRNDISFSDELITVRDWYCTLPESASRKLGNASWCNSDG